MQKSSLYRWLLMGVSVALALAANRSGVHAQETTLLRGVADVETVAWVTGPASPNQTDAHFNIYGTDLGSMFDLDGTLYIAFGDTFGCCLPKEGGAGGGDARSNTLAYTTDDRLSDGITFDGMITDSNGTARAFLTKQLFDITIIPTYGIGLTKRLYVHYMAVGQWGTPGKWTLNRSGWAYSDDRGQTWTQPSDAVWQGDTQFGQVALVAHDAYVYVFGIHGGRFGGAALARVRPSDILKMDSYQYWDGQSWSNDLNSASIIASAPIGELSVAWNAYLGRWIMTYLDEFQRAIVIREAPELTGPWNQPMVLVSGQVYPSLYGAFLHPWASSGEVIYFNMSQWGPYNVRLMRARLIKNQ